MERLVIRLRESDIWADVQKGQVLIGRDMKEGITNGEKSKHD